MCVYINLPSVLCEDRAAFIEARTGTNSLVVAFAVGIKISEVPIAIAHPEH